MLQLLWGLCLFLFYFSIFLWSLFFFLFYSGSTRCTAFLGVFLGGCCCLLGCRGFVCDFQEVKILLFSVAFPNSLFSFLFSSLISSSMDLHLHVFFQLAGGSVRCRSRCWCFVKFLLAYFYFSVFCVWHLVWLMWKCVLEPDTSASCFFFLLYEIQKGTWSIRFQ